ncbi:MAG: DUF2656 domain-containing protein [Symploca sp. SIO1C4]|uniref:DUF2656 domain-containing protein n=1 Tax=Symploca sp. SIO1C4 TaxID=2607765 RepID=A0A6B3N9F1_9CYAN|nr:DUF2656 domain-containing protein [Symploca sp. SIO1C4]
MTRMLFSYNHDKSGEAWSHEQFQQLIAAALADSQVTVSAMEHAHWLVEVSGDELEPAQIGQLIAAHIAQQRFGSTPPVEVLALGGQKTAPSTFSALGVGDWGVDVVESHNAQSFLDGIAWSATVQSKDNNVIFKVMSISSN